MDIKAFMCPYCKKPPVNPVSVAKGYRNKPNSITCCAECGNIIKFDGSMKAVKPTEEEFQALDQQYKEALFKAWFMFKLMKGLSEL